jgi:hypothetical protein
MELGSAPTHDRLLSITGQTTTSRNRVGRRVLLQLVSGLSRFGYLLARGTLQTFSQ